MPDMRVEIRAVLVLCACGGAKPVAVENRGGTASNLICNLPARLEFEARRYANLDADQPGYQTWSSWRVGIQLAPNSFAQRGSVSERAEAPDRKPRGTLAMVGDELVWNFDFTGKLDDRCKLELWTDTHEPIHVTIDLYAKTGVIRSIDDVWLLGPPFPPLRP